MIELSLWQPIGPADHPMWPIASAGLGVVGVAIVAYLSPRFREELSVGAERRVLSNSDAERDHRRFIEGS